jgi:tRNA(adenine34) deaminase
MSFSELDQQHMYRALELACQAEIQGEVPVGAVLTMNDEIIAEGWNCPISSNDPTSHAEIVVLRKGAKKIDNYRLIGATLYVTLEPCIMCAGAMIHSRIARCVFGAYDPKSGAAGSVLNIFNADGINHRVAVTGGLLAKISGSLLSEFFQKRR